MNFGFTYFSEVALLGWPLPYSMLSSIKEVKCLKISNMVWTEVWFPTLVSAFNHFTFQDAEEETPQVQLPMLDTSVQSN